MKRDKKEGEDDDDDGSGPNAGAAGCVLLSMVYQIGRLNCPLNPTHTNPHTPNIHSRKSSGPGGAAGGRPTATGASGSNKKPPSSR